MALNQYVKIAAKYLLEDLRAATLSSTMLSKILNNLEFGEKAVSNTALTFLKSRKFFALCCYAKKEITFSEYLIAAELEQKERRLIAEKMLLKNKLNKLN